MKIGIIGLGLIGFKRARNLKKKDIIIACDKSIKKIKKFKDEFNSEITTNYADVLNSDAKIIFICTTHDLLSKIAIKCLENKKHIFIEKPGTINSQDLKKIKQLSNKNKLRVKIGFNHRFHPGIIKAKSLIQNNNLGKLMFIKASYGHGGRKNYEKEWRFNISKSGGGELIDQGSHLIDLAVYFLGDLKVEYSYLKDYFWKKTIEDNIFISLKSSNDQIAWINASWTNWKNSFNFELNFKFGKIIINGLGKSYGIETLFFYKMNKSLLPPIEKKFIFKKKDESWKKEINNFINSINNKEKINGNIQDLMVVSKIIRDSYQKNNNSIKYNYK